MASVSQSSAVKAIAVYVVFAIDCVAVLFTPQPTNAVLAGACHLSPVASAESATILQEQSQRIVLSTQLRLASSQDHLPSVGIGVGGFQKEPDLIQDG
jgi:hypothetical protein